MATLEVERTVPRLADILAPVGDIPLDRILWDPLPGTATEADMIRLVDGEHKVLVELIDGILVEKPMSKLASYLTATLMAILVQFVRKQNLGLVGTPDLMMRVSKRRVRLPDISFTRWERQIRLDDETTGIVPFAPDLAVEVLSPSNTRAEIRKKVQEYFAGGCQLVWIFHPEHQSVEVYTSPLSSTRYGVADTLTGGDVLPGFELPLVDLFSDPQVQYYVQKSQDSE
jgi:Uma2 family endonuclease